MGVLGAFLVQTIKKVAELEEEERRIIKNHSIMDSFWQHLSSMNQHNEGHIALDEFLDLLSQPQTLNILQKLDVDPELLMSLADFVFEENQGCLSQAAFNQWVLDLRNSHKATLKDHYETRRFIKANLPRVLEAKGS